MLPDAEPWLFPFFTTNIFVVFFLQCLTHKLQLVGPEAESTAWGLQPDVSPESFNRLQWKPTRTVLLLSSRSKPSFLKGTVKQQHTAGSSESRSVLLLWTGSSWAFLCSSVKQWKRVSIQNVSKARKNSPYHHSTSSKFTACSRDAKTLGLKSNRTLNRIVESLHPYSSCYRRIYCFITCRHA